MSSGSASTYARRDEEALGSASCLLCVLKGNIFQDILGGTTCLILRLVRFMHFRRVKGHRGLQRSSPLLKKSCVRQVVLGKLFPLNYIMRYSYPTGAQLALRTGLSMNAIRTTWRDVKWSDVTWRDEVWRSVALNDTKRHNIIRHDMTWHGMAWRELTQHTPSHPTIPWSI